MRTLPATLALLAATLCGAAWSAPHTALTGVTVIDGRGNPPKPNQTLLLEEDRIAAIYPTGSRPLPDGVTVVALTGKHVIPGLIDSHVHLATAPDQGEDVADNVVNLRHLLHGGVTAVRDMGGDARVLGYLARQTLLDRIDGPDLFYSAIIAGPAFFTDPRTVASSAGFTSGQTPWIRSVTSDSDLPRLLAQAKGAGATGIKIYRNVPKALMAPLVEEAHRQGLKAWSHLYVNPASPVSAAEAGMDGVSHAAYFPGWTDQAYQRWTSQKVFEPAMLERAEVDELLAELKRQGVIIDATLVIFDRLSRTLATPKYINNDLAGVAFVQRAHQAGVRIAAGTDQGISLEDPTPPIHDELVLLVERGGLSPLEAIQAATHHGALLLGREAEFGAIEVGKKANLLVLNADPIEAIHNTRDIGHVLKNGRFIYRGVEQMNLPFSDARALGEQLILSGQIGNLPGTFSVVQGGIKAEMTQALANMDAVLRQHGMSATDVRKCTVMLADIDEWPLANEAYRAYFNQAPLPARSAFATGGLALDARVELECTAER
ncbi:amidohydrolase family protein [Ferrimonas balearica]|uniref:amidohydrolase family protein n=1 Tax=Ferrimonas balearica TaxID=44012 RepID=UPI001C9A093A|nr:amidohydrolase family protein [Ferrimonas balearica]MBY5993990.1 amidohydrolase family protein [Ferrimonas balearica]